MMLSETIYKLRRKNGLSQEQLAEKIGVSRQAVSKWENGTSTPELDKLAALSEIFNVTIDELNSGSIKEHTETPAPKEMNALSAFGGKRYHISLAAKLGIGLCIIGAFCLILFGVIMLAFPSSADELNQSSAVTVNGSGIALLLCVVSMVIGALMITKNTRR